MALMSPARTAASEVAGEGYYLLLSKLKLLVGTWTCPQGTTYRVVRDEEDADSCSVMTMRPDGTVRVTKAFVREGSAGGRSGSVTWGQNALDIDPDRPNVLRWASKDQSSKPIEWSRVDDPALEQRPRRYSICTDDGNDSEQSAQEDDPWQRFANLSYTPVPNGSSTRRQWRHDSQQRKSWKAASRPSMDYSYESTFAEDHAQLREAAVSLREAAVCMRQSHREQKEFEAVWKERTALVHEISSLARQRDREIKSLKRWREEESDMKNKLEHCRKVVARTVGSIDDIFAEAAAQAQDGPGEGMDSKEVRRSRRRASQAEAEAEAFLAMMGSSSEENQGPAGAPQDRRRGVQTADDVKPSRQRMHRRLFQ